MVTIVDFNILRLNLLMAFIYKGKESEKRMAECDHDYCYECGGYGDDYSYNEETGELVCNCDHCWNNPNRIDEDG